jgi:methyltransferase (TIGR00027 family)
MRSNQSSLTAMGTAAQRAIEMERPVEERICCDPIARQFLPAWFYVFMKRFTASSYAQKRAGGDLGFIAARCRYMDDVLSEELDQGIQQLGILGAGYDSRAYRFDRLKNGVKVFEVDHPATQKNKLKHLERILGSGGLPGYVTFVPVDFTRQRHRFRLLVQATCGAETGYRNPACFLLQKPF